MEIAGTEGKVTHSGVRVCGKLQSLTWLLSSHHSPNQSQIPAKKPGTARGWREPVRSPLRRMCQALSVWGELGRLTQGIQWIPWRRVCPWYQGQGGACAHWAGRVGSLATQGSLRHFTIFCLGHWMLDWELRLFRDRDRGSGVSGPGDHVDPLFYRLRASTCGTRCPEPSGVNLGQVTQESRAPGQAQSRPAPYSTLAYHHPWNSIQLFKASWELHVHQDGRCFDAVNLKS